MYVATNGGLHMAIHVQDEETDWLVREFARSRGLGITAAIKTAILEARERQLSAGDLLAEKLEPIIQQVRARRMTSQAEEDRLFLDEIWEGDG